MCKPFRPIIISFLLAAFLGTSVQLPSYAQIDPMPFMPAPGTMVPLSRQYTPAYLKGIVIHPKDPFKFDFIIYKGDKPLTYAQKKEEYTKLTKYFLASLAIPDDDQWVNLSPYEKDRIIKDDFGKTEMGRDILAQDYLLKQITASLIYPESRIGKEFWKKVYVKAQKQYGTTDIPVDTFNKVWILPDDALIYEKGNGTTNSPLVAYVLKNHLRVMLEEDYLSLQKHSGIPTIISPSHTVIPVQAGIQNKAHSIASQIIRQIILPELQKEVNEDANFAPLRQVYSGMLLATWFKRTLKQSLLGQIYVNKAKTKGVDWLNRAIAGAESLQFSSQTSAGTGATKQSPIEAIYQQYLQAYKKGVFNFIKEDTGRLTNETIPRKYFSGGEIDYAMASKFLGKKVIKEEFTSTLDDTERISGEMKDMDLAQVVMAAASLTDNIAIAKRLIRALRQGISVNRQGGYSMVIIHPSPKLRQQITTLARKLNPYLEIPQDGLSARDIHRMEVVLDKLMGLPVALAKNLENKGLTRIPTPIPSEKLDAAMFSRDTALILSILLGAVGIEAAAKLNGASYDNWQASLVLLASIVTLGAGYSHYDDRLTDPIIGRVQKIGEQFSLAKMYSKFPAESRPKNIISAYQMRGKVIFIPRQRIYYPGPTGRYALYEGPVLVVSQDVPNGLVVEFINSLAAEEGFKQIMVLSPRRGDLEGTDVNAIVAAQDLKLEPYLLPLGLVIRAEGQWVENQARGLAIREPGARDSVTDRDAAMGKLSPRAQRIVDFFSGMDFANLRTIERKLRGFNAVHIEQVDLVQVLETTSRENAVARRAVLVMLRLRPKLADEMWDIIVKHAYKDSRGVHQGVEHNDYVREEALRTLLSVDFNRAAPLLIDSLVPSNEPSRYVRGQVLIIIEENIKRIVNSSYVREFLGALADSSSLDIAVKTIAGRVFVRLHKAMLAENEMKTSPGTQAQGDPAMFWHPRRPVLPEFMLLTKGGQDFTIPRPLAESVYRRLRGIWQKGGKDKENLEKFMVFLQDKIFSEDHHSVSREEHNTIVENLDHVVKKTFAISTDDFIRMVWVSFRMGPQDRTELINPFKDAAMNVNLPALHTDSILENLQAIANSHVARPPGFSAAVTSLHLSAAFETQLLNNGISFIDYWKLYQQLFGPKPSIKTGLNPRFGIKEEYTPQRGARTWFSALIGGGALVKKKNLFSLTDLGYAGMAIDRTREWMIHNRHYKLVDLLDLYGTSIEVLTIEMAGRQKSGQTTVLSGHLDQWVQGLQWFLLFLQSQGPGLQGAVDILKPALERLEAESAIEASRITKNESKAMIASNLSEPGGIDLNSANLALHIKRDGHGMPLPLGQQDLAQFSSIQGLDPVILSIKPASQTPLFVELAAPET